jgi:DNA (cytosine-5)-methyltransferase 1
VLFAGGGGIECGFIEAGVRPLASCECDPENQQLSAKFAQAHEHNFAEYGHRLIQKTVQQCAASRWVDFPDYADFFHASLVCANFSNAKTDGVEEESDLTAATATADGIDHFKSWCFTLENVPGYQDSESWNQIIRPALKDYSVWSGVLNCADYGVPQNRKRFIVIAVREADFPVIPPPAWDTQLGWFDAIAPWWDTLPQSTLTEAAVRAVKGKSGIYLIPRLGYRNELPPVIPSDKPAPTIRKSIFLDDKGATRNRFLDIWSDGDTRNLTIPAVGYGLQTFPEWYEFPESGGTAGAIIGYSVPPLFYKQIVESTGLKSPTRSCSRPPILQMLSKATVLKKNTQEMTAMMRYFNRCLTLLTHWATILTDLFYPETRNTSLERCPNVYNRWLESRIAKTFSNRLRVNQSTN